MTRSSPKELLVRFENGAVGRDRPLRLRPRIFALDARRAIRISLTAAPRRGKIAVTIPGLISWRMSRGIGANDRRVDHQCQWPCVRSVHIGADARLRGRGTACSSLAGCPRRNGRLARSARRARILRRFRCTAACSGRSLHPKRSRARRACCRNAASLAAAAAQPLPHRTAFASDARAPRERLAGRRTCACAFRRDHRSEGGSRRQQSSKRPSIRSATPIG